MLFTISLAASVLAALTVFARRLDRRLRSGNLDLAHYHFGYFLGLVLCLLSLLALYRMIEEFASGQIPIAATVWLVLVLLAARGILSRRRAGWILATLLPQWFAVPAAAVILLSGSPGPFVIVAASLSVSLVLFIYARRRWHELGRRETRGRRP
jgi:hypothetical protein